MSLERLHVRMVKASGMPVAVPGSAPARLTAKHCSLDSLTSRNPQREMFTLARIQSPPGQRSPAILSYRFASAGTRASKQTL